MIPRRHAWLLRNTDTAYDTDLGRGHRCRICSATDRGDVWLASRFLDRHLADHRKEKLANDDAPTLTVCGAVEEDE